ncbi:hypothetical protein BH11MYX2_BH11MYX2_14230 [soil metagenome]
MPRPLRYTQPGTVYHLISRFVASEWFINSRPVRATYLRLLGIALATTDWQCLSFAIMSNHIHLALFSGEMPLANWLQRAHTPFAEWINLQRERIGAVFARGPKLYEVRADGVGRLINYIHRNPVRANVVPSCRRSDWTSHPAYAQTAPAPRWLDSGFGARLAGFRDPRSLANWIEGTSIERAELEAVTIGPVQLNESPRGEVELATGHSIVI